MGNRSRIRSHREVGHVVYSFKGHGFCNVDRLLSITAQLILNIQPFKGHTALTHSSRSSGIQPQPHCVLWRMGTMRNAVSDRYPKPGVFFFLFFLHLHLHLKLIKLGHFGQVMPTLFNLSLPIYKVGIKILKDYSQVWTTQCPGDKKIVINCVFSIVRIDVLGISALSRTPIKKYTKDSAPCARMLWHVADIFLLGRNVHMGSWSTGGKYAELREEYLGNAAGKGRLSKLLSSHFMAQGREMRPVLTLGWSL